jgi:acyl carrier protein
MRERIQEIFQTVLRDDTIELGAETRAADLPGWDSLAHINAMFGIEQEFGVQFLGDEFARVATIGELEQLLAEKGASA